MPREWHNIACWIHRWSRIQPGREAIVAGDRTLTWEGLDLRVTNMAAMLASRGVGAGARVGCLLRNRPEFLELFFATVRLGAVFVPYNVRLTAPELQHAIEDSDPVVVVTESSFAGVLEDVTPQLRDIDWMSLDSDALPFVRLDEIVDRAHPGVAPIAAVEPETPALILYTSGTTGLPKGAVLTHANIHHMTLVWIIDIGLGHEDRHLVYLPLSFAGGLLGQAMNPIHAGGTIILHEGFDPEALIALVERHRVTWTTGVPYTFQSFLESPSFQNADLSSLSRAMVGAAPPPIDVIRGFLARGIQIVHAYGLTEGTGGANLQLGVQDSLRKLGSMGAATSGSEVRVVDGDGNRVAVGEVGELQIRGPLVFAGYWRNPEASRAAMTDDGWLCTGDLVHCDDEGYHYTAGRSHDLIVSGGLNVYAAEVEAVLATHPSVHHVAVAGVPDDRWQEAVCAFVVLRPGTTVDLDTIRDHCRGRLADYRIPRQLVVVEDLPRTASGKVRKHELPGVVS